MFRRLVSASALLSLAVLGAPHLAHAAPPATLYVALNGTDNATCSLHDPCHTINHAIDVASAGATVRVEPGIYNQAIAIEKPITLLGTNPANTVIDGWNQDDAPLYGTVYIGGPGGGSTTATSLNGNVTVENFTFINPNPDTETGGEPMIFAIKDGGAGDIITVSNNRLVEGTLDTSAGMDFPVGIDTLESQATLVAERNTISGVFQGMLLEDNGPATLDYNSISGLIAGNDGTNTYPGEGIFLLADLPPVMTDISVAHNRFSGYAGDGVALEAGYPGSLNGSLANTSVDHNLFNLGPADGASAITAKVGGGASSSLDNITISYNVGTVKAPTGTITLTNVAPGSVTETHNAIMQR